MRLPIPDDWDNESWKCYKVDWPDSVLWKALFNGFISTYYRGWTWNEKTGSLAYAQAIGREIFERNRPYRYCSGVDCREQIYVLLSALTCWRGDIDDIPLPLTDEFIQTLIDCSTDCCDDGCDGGDDVPAITGIKCEDGWLWVQQCCQWVQVCQLASITGDTIPDDIPEPDPPPASPTCYKAGAAAQHFAPWLEGVVDLLEANPTWNNAESVDGIRALYPQNQWEWWSTLNMVAIYRWYPATVEAMVSDVLFPGRLQCALYFILEENGIPADNESWLLTDNDKSLWDSYLGNTLEYDPHAKAFAAQFFYALATAYVKTVVASYSGETYDCSGCIEDELSPQSATTASGWFLTQGYYGAGPQSASGESYNNVCLADEPDFPYNCWGVAFRIVSTAQQLWPGGIGSTGCTGQGISGGGSWSTPQYVVRCHADIWAELDAVSGQSYNRSDDGHFNSNNVSSPDDLLGDDFVLALRGGFNEAVVDVEATDIRFICNMNNLGV